MSTDIPQANKNNDAIRLEKAVKDFLQLRIENDEANAHKYEIKTYLTNVANNANNIEIGLTHVAKLTHPSNQAMNFREPKFQESGGLLRWVRKQPFDYLIYTQNLKLPHKDNCYNSASNSGYANFLAQPIDESGDTIGELIAKNPDNLMFFSINEKERLVISEAVKQAYKEIVPTSHALAKQIYQPMGESGEYYLLSPMVSSTLAQFIFETVKYHHAKDNMAKVARKNNVECSEQAIYFPNVASLSITKSKHLNASSLNNKRQGTLNLFPALPPKFNKISSVKSMSVLLSKAYNGSDFYYIKNTLSKLEKRQIFLNAERKKLLADRVRNLAYAVVNEIMLARNSNEQGWTQACNFTESEKVFLDSEILQNNKFSQPESLVFIDAITEKIVAWISKNIQDETRSKDLEKIWAKIVTPIITDLYLLIKE